MRRGFRRLVIAPLIAFAVLFIATELVGAALAAIRMDENLVIGVVMAACAVFVIRTTHQTRRAWQTGHVPGAKSVTTLIAGALLSAYCVLMAMLFGAMAVLNPILA